MSLLTDSDSPQLLLPAKPLFVWGSLIAALLINLMPWGRVAYLPDVLALVLVFWNIHQPRRVGLGTAFGFGLLMDVHQTALLGQHALAYTLLSHFAITLHRRVLWFGVWPQMLLVLPLFALVTLIILALRLLGGGTFPGWALLLAPLWTSALWPLAHWVLLAPQRRAPDPDKNRPL